MCKKIIEQMFPFELSFQNVAGFFVLSNPLIWAVTWQNQQSDCAPSEDSDQPGHLPNLISVFAVCMKKAWVFSFPLSTQRRLWSDWVDAQVDLNLRWAHSHFVGFVMSWLIFLPWRCAWELLHSLIHVLYFLSITKLTNYCFVKCIFFHSAFISVT